MVCSFIDSTRVDKMTVNYIVHNQDGKIMRTGVCGVDVLPSQAGDGESAIEGTANDLTQKIVGKKVIDKTPQEIVDETPIPPEPGIRITRKEWEALLKRIEDLEKI